MNVLDGTEVIDVASVAAMTSLGDLTLVLRSVREAECRLAAVKAAAIARAADGRRFRSDGHTCVSGWIRAETNCSPATAKREVTRSRALSALPVVAQALADGSVGIDQVDTFATLYANERTRPDLIRIQAELAGHAATLRFQDWVDVADRFSLHADPDGAEHSHDNARDDRHTKRSFVGTSFGFSAQGDSMAGAEIDEILNVFERHLFDQDWAAAKAAHGGDPSMRQLVRTRRQRAFDAFHAAIRAAAQVGPDGSGPLTTVVDIVIDEATLDETLRRFSDDAPAPGRRRTDDELVALLKRRSETVGGIQLDPRQVVAAMIRGRVRRVITDSTGLVIDLGRSQRLFRGAVRDAVLIAFGRCCHPGCTVQGSRCEIDHTLPWEDGGHTNPSNGAPGCKGQHVLRHRHRLIRRRHADGSVRTYRPDGTEIGSTLHGKHARQTEPGDADGDDRCPDDDHGPTSSDAA